MEIERKYKHRETWSNDEVRVLVNLWKERKDELNKVKRNQHIIMGIKKNMEDYQIFKDIDEIKNKMHNLNTKYRKEKNVATDATPSDWPLYGDLEEIYEGCNTKTIKFINHVVVEEPDPLSFRPKKLKKKNINEIILFEIKKSNEEMKKSNDNIEKYINQARVLELELLKVEKERNQILKLLIDKL